MVGNRGLEQVGPERRAWPIEAESALGQGEPPGDQLGIRALAAHARTEARIVKPAAAALADQGEHVPGAERRVRLEPGREQLPQLVRQAEQDVARVTRASRRGRLEHGLELAGRSDPG